MIDRVENIGLSTARIYTPENMHVFMFTHKLIISSPDSACPLNKKNRNIAEYADSILSKPTTADATCESTGNAAKNIIAEPVVAESTQTYQTYPIAEDAAKTKSICSTLAQMRSAIVTKQVPMETPASKYIARMKYLVATCKAHRDAIESLKQIPSAEHTGSVNLHSLPFICTLNHLALCKATHTFARNQSSLTNFE